MSITANIYYTGKNGQARSLAREMTDSGTAAAIRAEDGNEGYDYFFPMEDEETVLLIDVWRDAAALERHHASPMMERISRLREKYDLHMRVEKFVRDDGHADDDRYIRK